MCLITVFILKEYELKNLYFSCHPYFTLLPRGEKKRERECKNLKKIKKIKKKRNEKKKL